MVVQRSEKYCLENINVFLNVRKCLAEAFMKNTFERYFAKALCFLNLSATIQKYVYNIWSNITFVKYKKNVFVFARKTVTAHMLTP